MSHSLIDAAAERKLQIGKAGENLATRVDFSGFYNECKNAYGEGYMALTVEPAEDAGGYPVALTDGVYWDVTSADLAVNGTGHAELTYIVGDVVKKSLRWTTVVLSSLIASETPPERWEDYITKVHRFAGEAYLSAEAAHESAVNAAESADNALIERGYAAQAKTAAESARDIATAAKDTANFAAASAQANAEDANHSAGMAAESAVTAATNASRAASSAMTAIEMADIAESSATAAEDSANNAHSSAESSRSSEANAAESANMALSQRVFVEEAKIAAESAKEKAETAASGAQKSEIKAGQSEAASKQAFTDLLRMMGKDIATLDGNGKIPAEQIPAIATTEIYTVVTPEERDAIKDVQDGDICIVTAEDKSYIYKTDGWVYLASPTDYAARAGHADTAAEADNASRINGHRMVQMSEEEFRTAALDPDTYYLVWSD